MLLRHLLHKRYFEAFSPTMEQIENSRECRCPNCLAKSSRQYQVHGEHVLLLSLKCVLGRHTRHCAKCLSDISIQPFHQRYEERCIIITGSQKQKFKRRHLLKATLHAKSLQACLILCSPMDCSLTGSVHGILQARILEWVAMPPSRGCS